MSRLALAVLASATGAIPLLSLVNTFTANQLIQSTGPAWILEETDASVGDKVWALTATAGSFQINTLTDGGGSGESAISIARTGTTVDSITTKGDIIIADNYIELGEMSLPSNPASNEGRLYVKDVSSTTSLMFLDSAGIETNLTVGAVIPFVIDGGGSVIASTEIKGEVEVPFDCTIKSWRIFSQTSGSVVIDIWKDTFANYPPTVADTITASDKPTLSSGQKAENTNPSTWDITLSKGDILTYYVDSATTVTRVLVSLLVDRT